MPDVTSEPTLEINVPLLRKTLEHITAHPDEWIQESWAVETACGTACCLAGTAMVLAGATPDFEIEICGCGCEEDGEGRSTSYLTDGREIQHAATEELGLTWSQGNELFKGDNSLNRLWTLANRFTGGEIEPPADLPT